MKNKTLLFFIALILSVKGYSQQIKLNISFDKGAYEITQEHQRILRKAFDTLENYNLTKITISSTAEDVIDTAQKGLATRRTDMVYKYCVWRQYLAMKMEKTPYADDLKAKPNNEPGGSKGYNGSTTIVIDYSGNKIRH